MCLEYDQRLVKNQDCAKDYVEEMKQVVRAIEREMLGGGECG